MIAYAEPQMDSRAVAATSISCGSMVPVGRLSEFCVPCTARPGYWATEIYIYDPSLRFSRRLAQYVEIHGFSRHEMPASVSMKLMISINLPCRV